MTKNTYSPKNKRFKLVSLIAMILAISVIAMFAWSAVATTSPAYRDENGYANFNSFSGIETVKSDISAENQYNILEIIPTGDDVSVNAGKGILGYYINGQEPIGLDDLAKMMTQEERENYLAALLADLTTAGIVSTDTSAAITVSDYFEFHPWQYNDNGNGNFMPIADSDFKIELLEDDGSTRYETYTTTAEDKLDFVEDTFGDFIYTHEVEVVSTPEQGNTRQIVSSLTYGATSRGEDVYYYMPTFTTVFAQAGFTESMTAEELEAFANSNSGLAIYSHNGTSYDFEGILGDGFAFDLTQPLEQSKTYAILTDYGRPYTSQFTGNTLYLAEHGGYTADATVKNTTDTYFNQKAAAYRYVGDNNGNYKDVYSETAAGGLNIEYNEIYIRAFQNNNWFEKYVLDASVAQAGLNIEVNVKNAVNVTQADIDAADLIVFTNGFGVVGTTIGEIPAELSASFATYLGKDTPDITEDDKPLVVASSMKDITAINAYTAGVENDKVDNNIFVYSDFASSTFYQNDEKYDDKITSEIDLENFQRNISGAMNLPEEKTFANSIRYVINFSEKPEIETKSVIQVLEIQPIVSQTVSQVGATNSETTGGGKELTPSEVKTWLGTQDVEIFITTMAITEFIGKVDNVSEVYDLVYIGSSINGFNTRALDTVTKITNYNDDAMDGLIYTNIGDIIPIRNDIAGLLDTDYYTADGTYPIDVPLDLLADGTTIFYEEDAEVYPLKKNPADAPVQSILYKDPILGTLGRLSGYDITYPKLEELVAFVNSGLPIVISDGLINSDRVGTSQTDIKIEIDHTTLKAVDLPSNEEIYPNKVSYQWYKDGVKIEGETAYSYTVLAEEFGDFYCEVTFNNLETGEKSYGISNTITVFGNTAFNVTVNGSVTNEEVYLPIEFEYSSDGDFGYVIARLDENLIPTDAKVTYDWYDKTSNSATYSWEHSGMSGEFGDYATQLLPYTVENIENDTASLFTHEHGYTTSWWRRLICTATVVESDGTSAVYASNRVAINGVYPPDDAGSSTFYTDSGNTPASQNYLFTTAYDSTITIDENTGVTQLSANVSFTKNTEANTPVNIEIDETQTVWENVDTGESLITTKNSDGKFVADLTSAGEYRLKIVVKNTDSEGFSYLYSNTVIVAEGGRVTEDDEIYGTATPPTTGTTQPVFTDGRVDNSSKIWELIMGDPLDPQDAGVMNKQNVLSQTEAKGSDTSKPVATYVNLYKPEIEFVTEADGVTIVNKPIEYEGVYNIDLVPDDTLTFTFRINNPSDPTPLQTKYQLNLYLDTNGDGRYTSDEKISNVRVQDYITEDIVSNDNLIANNSYTATRELSEQMQGAITWKLEVERIGSSGITASQTGITFNKPEEAVQINVLQIVDQDSLKDSAHYSLSKNTTFQGYFNQLSAANIYDINVTTLSINDINKRTSVEAIKTEVFDNYHMIFIGFGESYGKNDPLNGFDPDAAQAINDFIESGKAVLFSHDNISTEVIPIGDNTSLDVKYPVQGGGLSQQNDAWFSGYFFNTLMRTNTGLDRYGVTDTIYGLTQNGYAVTQISDEDKANNIGITASAYEHDTLVNSELRDEIENIKEDGFDIAYEPGSQREEYANETQGFSTYMLSRSRSISSASTMLQPTSAVYPSIGTMAMTSYVSQVNKGQITTFPFDVNTSEFAIDGGGIGEELRITSTHHQWTQLNMNADDVTVWYCLSPTGATYDVYDNNYNDTMNNYYIYTKGNVTYTGAGHNGAMPTGDEAKLFINTMVAAYRASIVSPEIEFKENINSTAMEDKFIVAIEDDLDFSKVTQEELEIPFIFNDENSSTNKAVTIEFFYDDDNNPDTPKIQIMDNIPIMYANGDLTGQNLNETGTSKLMSNTAYYFKMPEETFNAVNENSSVEVEIKITVKIGSNTAMTDTASMYINKYNLLDLN